MTTDPLAEQVENPAYHIASVITGVLTLGGITAARFPMQEPIQAGVSIVADLMGGAQLLTRSLNAVTGRAEHNPETAGKNVANAALDWTALGVGMLGMIGTSNKISMLRHIGTGFATVVFADGAFNTLYDFSPSVRKKMTQIGQSILPR